MADPTTYGQQSTQEERSCKYRAAYNDTYISSLSSVGRFVYCTGWQLPGARAPPPGLEGGNRPIALAVASRKIANRSRQRDPSAGSTNGFGLRSCGPRADRPVGRSPALRGICNLSPLTTPSIGSENPCQYGPIHPTTAFMRRLYSAAPCVGVAAFCCCLPLAPLPGSGVKS